MELQRKASGFGLFAEWKKEGGRTEEKDVMGSGGDSSFQF